MKEHSSFILRIIHKAKQQEFMLHNLKTGQRIHCASWHELQKHLNEVSRARGLR